MLTLDSLLDAHRETGKREAAQRDVPDQANSAPNSETPDRPVKFGPTHLDPYDPGFDPDPLPPPHEGPHTVPITIPRDLAVQIVGSDAGKMKRFRPQSLMTKGASADDIEAVHQLMRPFVQDEITRVHIDKQHRVMSRTLQATCEQLIALKQCCLRYAAHLRKHLERHNHAPNHQRSQQRLDQANEVIREINILIGEKFDDGLTLDDCVKELLAQVARVETELAQFEQRLTAKRASWQGLGPDGERLLRIKQAIAFQPAMADILGIEMTPTTTEGSDTRGSA